MMCGTAASLATTKSERCLVATGAHEGSLHRNRAQWAMSAHDWSKDRLMRAIRDPTRDYPQEALEAIFEYLDVIEKKYEVEDAIDEE
jgi:outer membrane biosynthesis protein TonB